MGSLCVPTARPREAAVPGRELLRGRLRGWGDRGRGAPVPRRLRSAPGSLPLRLPSPPPQAAATAWPLPRSGGPDLPAQPARALCPQETPTRAASSWESPTGPAASPTGRADGTRGSSAAASEKVVHPGPPPARCQPVPATQPSVPAPGAPGFRAWLSCARGCAGLQAAVTVTAAPLGRQDWDACRMRWARCTEAPSTRTGGTAGDAWFSSEWGRRSSPPPAVCWGQTPQAEAPSPPAVHAQGGAGGQAEPALPSCPGSLGTATATKATGSGTSSKARGSSAAPTAPSTRYLQGPEGPHGGLPQRNLGSGPAKPRTSWPGEGDTGLRPFRPQPVLIPGSPPSTAGALGGGLWGTVSRLGGPDSWGTPARPQPRPPQQLQAVPRVSALGRHLGAAQPRGLWGAGAAPGKGSGRGMTGTGRGLKAVSWRGGARGGACCEASWGLDGTGEGRGVGGAFSAALLDPAGPCPGPPSDPVPAAVPQGGRVAPFPRLRAAGTRLYTFKACSGEREAQFQACLGNLAPLLLPALLTALCHPVPDRTGIRG